MLINGSASVIKIVNNFPIYMNKDIEGFATCLTLRDQAFRSGSTVSTAADHRRAVQAADPTATSAETYWGQYLAECEEEEREIAENGGDLSLE